MEQGLTPHHSLHLAGIFPCVSTTPRHKRTRHSRNIHTHFDSHTALMSTTSKLVEIPHSPSCEREFDVQETWDFG